MKTVAAIILLASSLGVCGEYELRYTTSGIQYAVQGDRSGPQPTLFVFALDIAKTLREDSPYNALGRELLKVGWLVVTFDIPCHGSDARPGEPLELLAWTTRLNAGEDIISAFDTKFRAVLDDLVSKNDTIAGQVAVSGTSRGGYLACHAAICDPRVTYVVPLAPIVNLSQVLGGLKLPPHLAHLESLYTYRENLAQKKVQIWIGPNDDAVWTGASIILANCIGSINPLAASCNIAHSIGHQTPPMAPKCAAWWLINEITPRLSARYIRSSMNRKR